MDPELKRLLEETHALARDNHRLLRTVRRHQLFETYWKIILWLLVLLAAYYAYRAYVVPFAEKYHVLGGSASAGSILNLPSPSSIGQFLNSTTGK
ncbi:MAG TPA: hypothetical protein VMV50_01810 [Candidatus Paceibacterota bacterium]|nr:hypothetical protein [Candidatus Paceibacterota bacterium]